MSTTASAARQTDTLEKRNPRTGELMYTVQEPSDDELSAVMGRARAAYEKIRRMTVRERIQELLKLKQYIIRNRQEIAEKICAENGKSLCDAMVGDVFTTVDLIDYCARDAEKVLADQKVRTPIVMLGKKSRLVYSPLGPCLVIAPWNYPLNTAITPSICAFAAGNSVIIKPSEWTPMRGLLDDILQKSGFIADGMQVVFGGRDTGRRLIDLQPAKIFFTGSVRGGKQIMKHASEYLIPVELELGGKDPMVIFDDCNLERAVNGAVWGALNNTGQGCTSAERCFVQAGIYDEFLRRIKEKMAKLSTTDTFQGRDSGNLDIGCITTPFQLEKIRAQVEQARGMGAEVWHAYPPVAGNPNYPPTIVTKVTMEMDIQCEETFGPVLTVTPFNTEEEAIRHANDTIYGLSSSVWTSDMAKADRFIRAIEAGNVCVNDVMVSEGNSALPFGGVKQSGIGRYKSAVGLHNFCNIKAVMIDPGKKPSEAHWYPYTEEKYAVLGSVLDAQGQGGIVGLLRLALAGLKTESLIKKHR